MQPKKLDPVEATIPSLDSKGIKGFQAIVVAVLLCGQAVDKKLLVELNTIRTEKYSATESTNADIDQLLEYFDT